jgi:putative flippase GtrA
MARAGLQRLRRPLTLLAVGAMATLLYAALAVFGASQTHLPASLVSLMAYALAAGCSYLAHRFFTFNVTGSHGDAPARFATLSLAGYAIAFLAPLILTDMLGWPSPWPIAVTCIAVPLFNAWALSRLIFRLPLLGATTPSGQP